jgi:hypothetical protein
MRVELIARKGNEVFHGWMQDSQAALKVSRRWADAGYAVTIVCHPK